MTTAIKAAKGAAIITLKGKGKALREGAFMRIAPLSLVEALSRTETIANLKVALGTSPTEAEISVAAIEWQAGRVANRLAPSEFPASCVEPIDRIDHARDLITVYAAPPSDGKPARKLKAGQKGRRTIAQHKAIRAAQEAWSQVLAELGFGTAKTQAERNADKAGKRATNANPVRGDGKGKGKANAATPSHGELVKAPADMTAKDVTQFLSSQSVTLLGFVNKHAKVTPAAYGAAVRAFHKAIAAAGREQDKAAN